LLEGNKYKSYLVKWLCINRMLEKMFGKRYNTRQILGEDMIYYDVEPYLNNWPRINCRMEGGCSWSAIVNIIWLYMMGWRTFINLILNVRV